MRVSTVRKLAASASSDWHLERSHDALTLAQELSHPFSLATALLFAAELHHFRREPQLTQERAEALIAICSEQGFPYWLAVGTSLQGSALVEQGQGEEGIAQMRQSLAAYRATGAELAGPGFLARLAEAYRKVGQVEDGLTVLAEALAVVEKTGERWYETELYRLKGELLLMKGDAEAEPFDSAQDEAEACFRNAEACFQHAIEVARRQQAKSLELRAVMSLSRLWQQQGKGEEARQLLAEIYGWFTEGFDTPDLKEAKVLLEALSC